MSKLTKAERRKQVEVASNLSDVDQKALKTGIRKVRNASGKNGNLNDNTKVNEQEMFAALLYDGLGKIDKDLQKSFVESLGDLIKNVKKFDPKNSVIRGAKRALKKLINSKELVKHAAIDLRRFSLGKAQLDSDNTRVSSSISQTSTESKPVQNLKGALERVSENDIADSKVHFEFKENNRAEFKKKKTDKSNKNDSAIDNNYKSLEERMADAKEVKSFMEGSVTGYTLEERNDKVKDFFNDELKAKDEGVNKRAEDILDDMNAMGSASFNPKNFDQKIKSYMKDFFDIDLNFKSEKATNSTVTSGESSSENLETSDQKKISEVEDLSITGTEIIKTEVEKAQADFNKQKELRKELALEITPFFLGEVSGFSEIQRFEKVKSFFQKEMEVNDEVTNRETEIMIDRYFSPYIYKIDQEALKEDIIIYMKNIFDINLVK